MDKSIVMEMLGLMEATPAVLTVAGIGFVFAGIVFVLVAWLLRRIMVVEHKYHLLNMSSVRLWDRVDPDMVQDHYSGEWSIKRRVRKE